MSSPTRFPVLGNPVRGPLHPVTWTRPPGNTDMKVTQDAASHAARLLNGKPRAMALDIGDGDPDRDELLAAYDVVVAEARTDGSANLALEFTFAGFRWRLIYAHNTLPHPVTVGQVLSEGAVVGRMGSTSLPSLPVPLHLHWQVGYWNGAAWVWVDPWPLLRQNQSAGGDMPGFKATGPVIGTFVMPAGGHALISPSDPKVRYPQPAGGTFSVFAALDLRTPAGVPIDIDGHSPPRNQRDQVYLVDAATFGTGAYALRSDGMFTPAPTASEAAQAVATAAASEATQYP